MTKGLFPLFLLLLCSQSLFSQVQVNNSNNAFYLTMSAAKTPDQGSTDTSTNAYLSLFRAYKKHTDSLSRRRHDLEASLLKHTSAIDKDGKFDKPYQDHLKEIKDLYGSEIKYKDTTDGYAHRYDSVINFRGDFRFWFPTTIRALRPATFSNFVSSQSNFNIVNSVQFQAQKGVSSLYAELLGTNIGHLRFSLGTMVSSNNDSSIQKQTLQTFLSSGGNTVLNAYYPIAYFRKSYFTFLWQYSPKIGGQIPGMGTYTDVFTGNAQLLASDMYMDFTSFDNALGIYAVLRGSATFGTKDFYDNLDIPHKLTGLLQLNAGLVVNSNVRISISGPLAASSGNLLRFPWLIGVQLMPTSNKKVPANTTDTGQQN